MEIRNTKDAANWIRAWDGKPRAAVAQTAAAGLRTSAAISRQCGNDQQAAHYTAAADMIDGWCRSTGIYR